MLEIVDKTLNGVSQPPQTFSFSTTKIGISNLGTDTTATSTSTLPLVKTIAKPNYAFFYITSSAGTDSDGYAENPDTVTINGVTNNIALAASNYGMYCTMATSFMNTLNTTTDTTISTLGFTNDISISGASIQPQIAFSDYSLNDYATGSDNVTIRYRTATNGNSISTDIPDPTTDFSSFGTEFTGSEYTDTSDWTTGSVSKAATSEKTVACNAIMVANISNVSSNAKAIALCTNVAKIGGHDNNTNTMASTIYVWNFTTSSWESCGALNAGYTWNAGTQTGHIISGGPMTRALLTPGGTEGWALGPYADYISGGEVYFGVVAGSSPSSSDDRGTVGIAASYFGVLYIQGNIWT